MLLLNEGNIETIALFAAEKAKDQFLIIHFQISYSSNLWILCSLNLSPLYPPALSLVIL